MALCNFDFGSLASAYDRIMNVSRNGMQTKSQQAQIFASIVKVIREIVKSFQLHFRFDTSLSGGKDRNDALSMQSILSHLLPGEVAWHEEYDARIDIDGSANSQFFGFVMKIGQSNHENTILDKRLLMQSMPNLAAT